MRWLTLYARSRQVPASLAAVLISAVVVWALADGGGGEPGKSGSAALVVVTGAMVASIGFAGQDLALDRTAAIRWTARRAGHVLLAGAVVAAAPLGARTLGEDLATAEFIVRDSAGLMGLAALGAVVCGRQYAWTLPVGWFMIAYFAPPATSTTGTTSTPMELATWMLLPPDATTGIWSAAVLAVAGTVTYAVAGPRR
ncbi:hypothetical protein [Streptomyces sp. NPDC091212]|uniref:hypothetical protein n=1 Tax=Streptomyces sp. NPDC091212 TaxID=3155191 RepID=UPI003436DEDB